MRELTATSVAQVRVQQILYGIMIAFSVFMGVFLALNWKRGFGGILVCTVVGAGVSGTFALFASFRFSRFLASAQARALVAETKALKGLGFDDACQRLDKQGRRVREEHARAGDPRLGFKPQRVISYDCDSLFVTIWENAEKVGRVALFVPRR